MNANIMDLPLTRLLVHYYHDGNSFNLTFSTRLSEISIRYSMPLYILSNVIQEPFFFLKGVRGGSIFTSIDLALGMSLILGGPMTAKDKTKWDRR